jgi:hypothetical protein
VFYTYPAFRHPQDLDDAADDLAEAGHERGAHVGVQGGLDALDAAAAGEAPDRWLSYYVGAMRN